MPVSAAGLAASLPRRPWCLLLEVSQRPVCDACCCLGGWVGGACRHLRTDPQEHAVVLTEPPLNPPESREAVAEIFFESFGVAGLYCGVQPVLALYAGWAAARSGVRLVRTPG